MRATRVGKSFVIKIVPPKGYNVYRLHVSRGVGVGSVVGVALLLLGGLFVHAWQLRVAEAHVQALQSETSLQSQRLGEIDREAAALATQLQQLQRENDAIRRQPGVGPAPAVTPAPKQHAELVPSPADMASFPIVAQRLSQVRAASHATGLDESRLAQLVARVLDLRRLARIARVRMLAAIPSVNPVPGSEITSGYGYRLDPWPEFHEGVDLAADYGTPIHATAAGTVVFAGWDGGFGNKVALDHGNGYQSWYGHMSRFAVAEGARVHRGDVIGFVGASGEATGPHVHYQLMFEGKPIDPTPFLTGIPRSVMATLPSTPRVQ